MSAGECIPARRNPLIGAFTPGQPVLADGHLAVVKFVGSTDFQPAGCVGVEYQRSDIGKCDGSFAGRKYFECKPGFGAFLSPKAVSPYLLGDQARRQGYLAKKSGLFGRWHRRWVVVRPGQLVYYHSFKEKPERGKVTLLREALVEISSADPTIVIITAKGQQPRSWKGISAGEIQSWTEVLRAETGIYGKLAPMNVATAVADTAPAVDIAPPVRPIAVDTEEAGPPGDGSPTEDIAQQDDIDVGISESLADTKSAPSEVPPIAVFTTTSQQDVSRAGGMRRLNRPGSERRTSRRSNVSFPSPLALDSVNPVANSAVTSPSELEFDDKDFECWDDDIEDDSAVADIVPASRQPKVFSAFSEDTTDDFTTDFAEFDDEAFARRTSDMSYFKNTVSEITQVRRHAESWQERMSAIANPQIARALAEIIGAKSKQIERAHARHELDDSAFNSLQTTLREMRLSIARRAELRTPLGFHSTPHNGLRASGLGLKHRRKSMADGFLLAHAPQQQLESSQSSGEIPDVADDVFEDCMHQAVYEVILDLKRSVLYKLSSQRCLLQWVQLRWKMRSQPQKAALLVPNGSALAQFITANSNVFSSTDSTDSAPSTTDAVSPEAHLCIMLSALQSVIDTIRRWHPDNMLLRDEHRQLRELLTSLEALGGGLQQSLITSP